MDIIQFAWFVTTFAGTVCNCALRVSKSSTMYIVYAAAIAVNVRYSPPEIMFDLYRVLTANFEPACK